MDNDERRKNLLLFVDHLLDVHDQWIQSEFEPLPQSFEEAADSLLAIFEDGAIPAECRTLFERVKVFGEQWETWKAGGALSGEQYPESNAFWAALEAVRDAKLVAADTAGPPPLEPITELERQKVGDAQICAIYGFGTLAKPDMRKLAEERKAPGTHTGKDFVSPGQQEFAARERKVAEHTALIRRLQAEKLTPPVAPEGIPELVEQGVSASQIAAMHGKTVDEVYAECDRLKLPRPDENYADPHTARAPHEPGIPDEVERAMPGPLAKTAELTLEQEIVQAHQQGIDSKEIAELLSTPQLAVTHRKVQSVVRRFKQSPEAFTSSEG